ncbi:hypothetical protein EUGRSUZ_F02672 [Eucalyptus grandis]|uniref:Uncharacterized protein n=2 Tax=Eucalyptus grandis TaxID=71139 RepID=A0A059BU12_EUCGR|nr:hypothetical protein EUGRSUZ_F02672 [Eucalyptus grandis]
MSPASEDSSEQEGRTGHMAGSAVATVLKGLFLVLGCFMVATLVYTIAVDGLPFRSDLLTTWMAATLVDYYINVVPLAAWVWYKESNFFSALLWTVLLICLGSVTTCFYILLQFLKLSPQESSQDPIYHVLLQHSSKDGIEQNKQHFPVIIARITFIVLGCLMLATLLYTIFTDGSPFRKELLTPWMTATLIDFYINVVVLSVWVAYKESSWLSAFVWILLLICFGSISTCAYIVRELFQLSSQDPLYFVLFNNGYRYVKLSLRFDFSSVSASRELQSFCPKI